MCEKGRESGDLFKAMLISKSWTETADQLSALQKTLLTFKPKHEINMTVDTRGTHTHKLKTKQKPETNGVNRRNGEADRCEAVTHM